MHPKVLGCATPNNPPSLTGSDADQIRTMDDWMIRQNAQTVTCQATSGLARYEGRGIVGFGPKFQLGDDGQGTVFEVTLFLGHHNNLP